MRFFNKEIQKIKAYFQAKKQTVKQFSRLLEPYFRPETRSDRLSTAIVFGVMQFSSIISMIVLTEAQNNQVNTPNSDPAMLHLYNAMNATNTSSNSESTSAFVMPNYCLPLISAMIQTGLSCLQFSFAQKSAFSIENNLKKDLLLKLSKHKTSIGLDFVRANRKNKTPLNEVMSQHIKQFSQESVVVSFDLLNYVLFGLTNLYGASRTSNKNTLVISSAMALGLILASNKILSKKAQISRDIQKADNSINADFNNADKARYEIIALDAEGFEYNRMMHKIQSKEEKFKSLKFQLDILFNGIVSFTSKSFPVLLKTIAPALLHINANGQSDRLDILCAQMLSVLLYMRESQKIYMENTSRMHLSMQVLEELRNDIDQWADFYSNQNRLSIQYQDKKHFGFSNVTIALPLELPIVYLVEITGIKKALILEKEIQKRMIDMLGSIVRQDVILVKTGKNYYLVRADVRTQQLSISASISSLELNSMLSSVMFDQLSFSQTLNPVGQLVCPAAKNSEAQQKKWRADLDEIQNEILELARTKTIHCQSEVPTKSSSHVVLEKHAKTLTFSFTHKVDKILEEEQLILDSANLTLEKGKIYKLCAASGKGKSTIIKMLAGNWPYAKGKLNFPWTKEEHAQKVYLVSQNTSMPTNMSLLEAISYPHKLEEIRAQFRNSNSKYPTYDEQVRYLMLCLNLGSKIPYLDHKREHFNMLSGGEMQRISILRVLLRKQNPPALLMLDEATASIDKRSTMVIESLIRSELPNTTVLYVDHKPFNDQKTVEEDATEESSACIRDRQRSNFQFANYELNIQNKKLNVVKVDTIAPLQPAMISSLSSRMKNLKR